VCENTRLKHERKDRKSLAQYHYKYLRNIIFK